MSLTVCGAHTLLCHWGPCTAVTQRVCPARSSLAHAPDGPCATRTNAAGGCSPAVCVDLRPTQGHGSRVTRLEMWKRSPATERRLCAQSSRGGRDSAWERGAQVARWLGEHVWLFLVGPCSQEGPLSGAGGSQPRPARGCRLRGSGFSLGFLNWLPQAVGGLAPCLSAPGTPVLKPRSRANPVSRERPSRLSLQGREPASSSPPDSGPLTCCLVGDFCRRQSGACAESSHEEGRDPGLAGSVFRVQSSGGPASCHSAQCLPETWLLIILPTFGYPCPFSNSTHSPHEPSFVSCTGVTVC